MAWRPIPGFSRYEVSDTLQVRKAENFQVLKKDFHSVYLARNGIRYGFTVEELLDAAKAGREPNARYAKRKVERPREPCLQPITQIPCPHTEALLEAWTKDPIMSGLDAAWRSVGY
ncbi:MAG: hypothetical protein HY795_06145 [Desulfovibrio sp.]|nr:hypothetical protein [Desulfovibrio sp.]